jgi:lambda repressor-like predicted transcriptional regulator
VDVEQKATTDWQPQALRQELKARGVSIRRLAIGAGEWPNNLYDALAGLPVGPVRRARITAAARRLLGETGEDS